MHFQVPGMKITRVLFIGLLILLPQILAGTPASCLEMSVQTRTRSGPLTLTVRFKEGKRDWAQSILDESPDYIRKVERYMNSPLGWNEFMIIEGCDNCTSRAELSEHKIYLDYRYSTPEDVSVLFHEINHFWFYYFANRSSEEWLIEGISSFLPNALRDMKLLPDRPLYREVIDSYWGIDWPIDSSLKDVPLYPFNEGKRRLVYTKSYRLQYLFYCILGEKNYRSFVRKISSTQKRRPPFVIATLKRYKRLNWKRILSGWVIGRKYRSVSLADFTNDGDSDALSRAREYCLKTDASKYDTDSDSLPDGAEVALGRNPRRPDADGHELLLQHGPFADGSDADWAPFQATHSIDPPEDVRGPGCADMHEMLTIIRNGSLHVLVKTASLPQKPEKIFFDILVDTNSDFYTDEEFAFFLNTPAYPWHYSPSSDSSNSLAGLKAASGDYIEMVIPLSAIPSQSFQILPIIRNNDTKENYDTWENWVAIPG